MLCDIPMVLIPEGDIFYRGRTVHVESFYMSITPITKYQYLSVYLTSKNILGTNSNKEPITNMNYQSCLDFCKSTNTQLPTEVQWEYAASDIILSLFNLNANISTHNEYCWTIENSNNRLNQVKKKSPNKFGLYDIVGNIYHICEPHFYIPSAKETKIMLKGIPFNRDIRDMNELLYIDKSTGQYNVGFRVVKKVEFDISNVNLIF